MGIYDRDYYREPSRSFSMGEYPGVYTLMGLSIFSFLMVIFATGNQTNPIVNIGVCDYASVLRGEVWRLLTGHLIFPGGGRGLLSLAISMMILYSFGSELEAMYRTKEFLAFVVVTALLITLSGTLAHLLNPQLFVGYYGVQGVVTGLVVLYACHFPKRELLVMFVLPLPTWVVAICFALYGVAVMPSTPVSVAAPVGFAIVYYRFHIRITNLLDSLPRRQRQNGPRLYAPSPTLETSTEPSTRSSRSAAPTDFDGPHNPYEISSDENLEAKLDSVLEKVSRQGRASLSSDELALLNRASEIYKKRRQ